MSADDVLAFAGVPPPRLKLYPIETHTAEKLHAYTMPRPRPNTGVKDLPDLALLGSIRPLDAAQLRRAIELTFTYRGTHPVPTALPAPPPAWEAPYARLAREDALRWPDASAVTAAARAFLDPVLANEPVVGWEPGRWAWR